MARDAPSDRTRPREHRLHHRADHDGGQRDAHARLPARDGRTRHRDRAGCDRRGRFFGRGRLSRGGAAVRYGAPERDFRGQRHDGDRRAARRGGTRFARADRLLDHRFRRYRAGQFHVAGAVDGRSAGAFARRNGGAHADRAHRLRAARARRRVGAAPRDRAGTDAARIDGAVVRAAFRIAGGLTRDVVATSSPELPQSLWRGRRDEQDPHGRRARSVIRSHDSGTRGRRRQPQHGSGGARAASASRR
ncbi:hypothetical protein PSP6_170117 [Paraburkholderia tropica]|nr:hypothetical protein PSP6_170117 [Paraburkholderia tropica]